MKNANRKYVWPMSVATGLAIIGIVAAIIALTPLNGSIQAQDDSTAVLTVSPNTAEPGDTIAVRGSGFRVGTEASFIYASTITIGDDPIASVASVDLASGFLHAGRTTDSGTYIAEHIDIDPADTVADGMFVAEFVLPDDLSAGIHELKVTSCWGGADDAYPEDGVPPCGEVGLGGGVNDRIATADITITVPETPTPVLTVTPSTAQPGDTIMVRGSDFRVGTEASFIYSSTITIGGTPIAGVATVDLASGFLHAGRTTDSGLSIAQHIDIDPANTAADGMFVAEFTLPNDLSAGEHELKVTSCWGGADESYPQDGVAPCGTVGLGGGVNDRVATTSIAIEAPDPAVLTLSSNEAEPGGTITVRGSGFRVGTEASFIYASTITIGGMPIGKVASVDLGSGYLHGGRYTDSGLYIAEHIDIDPANTTADGAFIAELALPYNLRAGTHELRVISCWGGADDAYPEDGIGPCGTVGQGGGVNDRVATVSVTVD